jgi:transposase InsO family protein
LAAIDQPTTRREYKSMTVARYNQPSLVAGMQVKTKRKFKATPYSDHDDPIAPNLLNRALTVDKLDTCARWLSEAYWLPLSLCQSKSFAGFLWLSAIDNASFTSDVLILSFKATPYSDHDDPIAPNLLNRALTVDKLDTCYVGDITYIATREGWLYLAGLL